MVISVKKYKTSIEKLFTYFEFNGYNNWDNFDELLFILNTKMNFKISKKVDGIYSRHCFFEKDGFTFQLMYHEDIGNCLCSKEKRDNDYYDKLGNIADSVVKNLNPLF